MPLSSLLLVVAIFLAAPLAFASEAPLTPSVVSANSPTSTPPGDRAIALLENFADKTGSFIEKNAPEVWRIYVQQIEVEASTNWVNSTLFFVLMSFGVFFSVRRFRFYKEKKENAINRQSEWDFQNCAEVSLIVAWALAVVSLTALIIGMSDIVRAVEMTRNHVK